MEFARIENIVLRIFTYLTVLISVFLSSVSYSQHPDIHFEHFEIEQGIPPSVPCILQDRTGYIWFGTYYGIYRYDGYSIVSYMPDESDTNSITNAIVNALCDDKEGNIWIGHSQGVDKFNPSTEIFTHYILNKKTPLSDWSNHVLSMLVDRKENLWVGTGDGLYLFDKNNEYFKRFVHDSTDPGSLIQNSVNDIYESRDGSIWFATGNGLDKLDENNNKFIHYWSDPDFKGFSWGEHPHWLLSIFEDRDGIIWLGTSGLVEFNRRLNSFTLFKNDPKDPTSLGYDVVTSIGEDSNGSIWAGTLQGVDIFDKNSKKFSHYNHNEKDPGSLSSSSVGKILFDKSGIMWVTTLGGGVNKYTPQNSSVKFYSSEFEDKTKLPIAILETLVEDNKGKIWIGSGKGLLSFDPLKEVFKEEPLKGSISPILVDLSGTLWIISWTGNLFYKKANEEKINQFFESNGRAFYYAVNTMCAGRNGNIWLGTGDGKVLKLFPAERRVEQIAKYSTSIDIIYEDKTGLLWIGTHDAGLICYNPNEKTFTRFSTDPKDPLTISGNEIMGFCEDGTGTLWIVASTSLSKYDRETGKCIKWGGKDGFPKDALSITTDVHGNLWISTIDGEIQYNPVTKKFKNYPNIRLSYGYKMRNGEMYFLSAPFYNAKQVIVRFNPDSVHNNSFIPPVVITSFKKFEKSYPFGKEIQLSYYENYLSFEFAALSFIHPEKNQYAYKMEGIDKDWVYSGTRRYASYPNLSHGKYIFRVKGSNNDGIWNEKGTSITIIISPPWWQTWWAYGCYGFVFVFSLLGIRRYELNRMRLKDKIKMDAAVLKEKEETDIMKSRFFANISHEFRTPLTLILGPAEKIEKNQSANPSKDAGIITRNSRRLLQLVNQLLDLSKLDAGKLKLEASSGNIVSFVKGISLSFESLSESKDIMLRIKSDKEFIEVFFDKEKMIKVFSNLLANAFKFTPERGNVIISMTETANHEVEISIRNTGIGIQKKELSKLFDRFYQVDSSQTKEYEGTGIGLALVKELIELHHGKITADSEVGSSGKAGWTEFTITLPLGRAHLKAEEILSIEKDTNSKFIRNPEEVGMKNVPGEDENIIYEVNSSWQTIQNDTEKNGNKTIILVVEDNYDMREYIKESLSDTYAVEEAVNGEQGIRIAETIIPDLIISDLMMPKMDGNELTRILKNDEKTSHIPIIILTAKSGQENKIEGLMTGADDYLTKPFDLQELRVRVENLINIRKKLQEKFSKGEFLSKSAGKKLKSIDEKFLAKVLEVIEKHLSEEDFSIEECSNEVGMSRTHLHKKLRALVGKSPSQYVRTVRLYRAKQLIEEEKGNISEIAYLVGFSSPAYFSKCFKDEFGYPPRKILG